MVAGRLYGSADGVGGREKALRAEDACGGWWVLDFRRGGDLGKKSRIHVALHGEGGDVACASGWPRGH